MYLYSEKDDGEPLLFSPRFPYAGLTHLVWVQIFVPKEMGTTAALNPLAEPSIPKEPTRVKIDVTVRVPTWWEVPASLYVPASSKEKSIAAAKKLMKHLENSKVAGQDYSLDTMIRLYKTCEVYRLNRSFVHESTCTVGTQRIYHMVR